MGECKLLVFAMLWLGSLSGNRINTNGVTGLVFCSCVFVWTFFSFFFFFFFFFFKKNLFSFSLTFKPDCCPKWASLHNPPRSASWWTLLWNTVWSIQSKVRAFFFLFSFFFFLKKKNNKNKITCSCLCWTGHQGRVSCVTALLNLINLKVCRQRIIK